MSLSKEQREFTKDITALMLYAERLGIELTLGEAFRTNEQQAIHLKNKKTTVKHSRHQDRLAIDFNFFIDDKLTYEHIKIKKLGVFWQSLNNKNRWGGFWKFKDTPHFERKV